MHWFPIVYQTIWQHSQHKLVGRGGDTAVNQQRNIPRIRHLKNDISTLLQHYLRARVHYPLVLMTLSLKFTCIISNLY